MSTSLIAEPVSALSHLVGAIVALLAGIELVRRAGPSRERTISLGIYVACVVALLIASGMYHLVGDGHPWRAQLRRLDHAAIWLQIAGTFTPIHIIFFRGGWRLWPLVVVWSGALLGILLKLVFFDHVPEAVGLSLYLALGWSGFFSMLRLMRDRGFHVGAPILHGGAIYSCGAVLELTRYSPFPHLLDPHELFHFAVLGGIVWHWTFIRRWAGGAPAH